MSLSVQTPNTKSSEKIILLHGYGSRARDLKELIAGFGDQYEVFAPDLGRFYLNRKRQSFSQQVLELCRILKEQVGDKPYHLVGFSYGGALAWAIASRIGKDCQSLVMINPMSPFPVKNLRPLPLRFFFSLPWNTQFLVKFLRVRLGGNFLSYLMRVFGRHPMARQGEKTLKFISHVIDNFLAAVSEEDWGAWELSLAEIKCPSLICYSANDPLFQPDSYLKIGRSLEDVRFVQLRSNLHLPTVQELSSLSHILKNFIDKKELEDTAA